MQEVDVQEEVVRHWGNVYKYLALVFASTGLPAVVASSFCAFGAGDERHVGADDLVSARDHR